MIILINTSSIRENGESVLFQLVLKAYPTHHPWLITAHISLGHLEQHWKSFTRQMDRTHQIIQSLSQWPSAPTQLLSAELTNINDIYTSYKPIITPVINLLATDPSIDGNFNCNRWVRRSLLPILGTATTKDVNSIEKSVNQLIETQSMQQETIVHILSILKVTWYAAQVNRQHINIIMNRADEIAQDINNLYNLTTSLATSFSYYQLVLDIRSVLANLQYLLSYIKSVSMHIMDYVNTATTRTLSPHMLPIADLKQVLSHIEESLPTTMHLPVTSEDTLHFYRYLHKHILIANIQALLLIDVPIQDWTQQISIYRIFTLDIPHGNCTAHYEIDTKYLRITQDKTMAGEILDRQFSTCKEANGQFCSIYTSFQPLANPPTCITALYSKNAASIATRCSLQVR